ncbi:MAG TPA: glutamine--fructose-6-phosphate transaminase (isomerizing) [Solirubrobacterales bacterium]|nr:glutamine--fructose-6-phosphate transaminase (isomerizing) [Solirubrobacterales bacterium]
MCGIIGYVGKGAAVELLVEGLEVLEYRGYDSAGVALDVGGELEVHRAVGPVAELSRLVGDQTEASGGLGHTRWATHGGVSVDNAHPLTACDGRLAVVLNGIVENFTELRDALLAAGHRFSSETDAEVVSHLIEQTYEGDLAAAVAEVSPLLRGHFAFAACHEEESGRLVATRRSCPLVLGRSGDGTYLASMSAAFATRVAELMHLEDDEVAEVDADGIRVRGQGGGLVDRRPLPPTSAEVSDRAGHSSFMAKEIAEQPAAIRATLRGRLDSHGLPSEPDLAEALWETDQIVLVACGTAYHAALYGGYLLEDWAQIPCRVEIASEWRYRAKRLPPRTSVILVSQSGETADTLQAQAHAVDLGAKTLAVCNVADSQLVRQADATILTRAGFEVGVAATKTFTAQVVSLAALALQLAAHRRTVDPETLAMHGRELRRLPLLVERFLESDHPAFEIADRVFEQPFFLYLGRGFGLPIALEGALKLKEISYIPTDAYAAGEMKHGPIALLSQDTPVICVAPDSPTHEKLVSNVLEVKARGASVVAVASTGNEDMGDHADEVIYVPRTTPELGPLLCVPALQLLALRIAERRGRNVDRPRNLAKTVTVE